MSASPHPSRLEIERFLRGPSAAEAEASGKIVSHFLAGCALCHQQLESLGWDESRVERLLELRAEMLRDELDMAPLAGYDYDAAFAGAERALAAFFAEGRTPQVPAEDLWSELSPLSAEQQVQRMGSDRRFANPDLVRQLIDGSRTLRYQDPRKIQHLAHLACIAAEGCAVDDCGSPERLADLRAQSWRQYGNALRVQGRLREADAALARAQRLCEEGTGDPPLRARLLAQKASLRIAQRRFEEALYLTEESGRIFRAIGQLSSLAGTLVQKATAHLYSGSPEEAVRALNRALPLIAPEEDPHLLLVACHNLVRCYVDLGQPEQALSLYFEAKDLYHEFTDALILLRAGWQEGQLLRDLGYLRAAEVALLTARNGFSRQDLLYEAAMVSLDLAAVYVHLTDREKLEQTVVEAVPIFRAIGVDREVLASLLQLRQLAEDRRQAFELIRALASQVEAFGRRRLA